MESAFRDRVRAARALRDFLSEKKERGNKRHREEAAARHRALLDRRFSAGLKLVYLALNGDEIPETRHDGIMSSRGEKVESELCMAFMHCVYTPVQPSRAKLLRVEAGDTARIQAKLNAVVSHRLRDFYSLAEFACKELKSRSRDYAAASRCLLLQTVLKRCLLCICDSYRYMVDLKRAGAALSLAQSIAPEDPEVHDKLAVLFQVETSPIGHSNLAAMHHYCRALCADKPLDIDEKSRGYSFVAHVKSESERAQCRSTRAKSACWRFSNAYIALAWAILANADAQEKVRASDGVDAMWDDLDTSLQIGEDSEEHLSETDLLHLVGTCVFVRYRSSPRGHPSGSFQKLASLADDMSCQLVLSLAKQTRRELEDLVSAMRARKKNRLRAMQKKRQAAPGNRGTAKGKGHLKLDASSVLGLDVLISVVSTRHHLRTLGALSFMAHFWSKTLVITPMCELQKFKRVYDSLAALFSLLDRVFELAGVPDAGEQIVSLVLAANNDIPQQAEDAFFAHFEPCKSTSMFRRVEILKRDLESFFGAEEGSVVEMAISSAVAAPRDNKAHENGFMDKLESFASRLNVFPLDLGESRLGQERTQAPGILTSMGLRRQRLLRLRDTLTKHASGRIPRLLSNSEEQRSSRGTGVHSEHCASVGLGGAKRTLDQARQATSDAMMEAACNATTKGATLADLPRYKRRRIVAAKSQQPWDGDRPPNFQTVQAFQTPEPKRSLSEPYLEGMRHETPVRTAADDTPVPLAQAISPRSPKSDTPLMPRESKVGRGRTVADAVNLALFGCSGAAVCDSSAADAGFRANFEEQKLWVLQCMQSRRELLLENPFLAQRLHESRLLHRTQASVELERDSTPALRDHDFDAPT